MLSNSELDFVKFLDEQRGVIRSRTGGWKLGEGVYSHGYSMLDELVGKKSYFQTLILNATGKLVDRKLADWVEAIYGCLSWPDPRIWCNQIGALAGANRASVVAATALGTLASDSRSYGVLPLIEGVSFIQDAYSKHKSGLSVAEIVKLKVEEFGGKPFIVGFKRPIAKGDERLETMEKVSEELGFEDGEHLSLAYQIEQHLLAEYNEGMNINGYMSGFLSDQGFTPKEVYQIFAMLVMSGVTACFLEAEKRPVDSFMPLRCEDIDYKGSPRRSVPDKE